jgi:fatty-acid desaturase
MECLSSALLVQSRRRGIVAHVNPTENHAPGSADSSWAAPLARHEESLPSPHPVSAHRADHPPTPARHLASAVISRLKPLEKKHAKETGVNWTTATFMVLFHLGALASVFFFTWQALLLAIFLFWVSGSLGIGICYHRLLTHRGYKTPKWLEYVLTVCATLALEGGPIFWVATHRIHHQFSDKEGDPHSPLDGKWWAHVGWILIGKSMHHDSSTLARYVPDLAKDRFHVWITKYHYVPMIVLGLILLAIGGWPFLFWGIFFRTVFGLHATWLVNSATHIWGSRRFPTRDHSTNNFLVALFTFGEGWHNNHHAHPTSARHGLKWYEPDINWYGIWVLKQLRLAKQVYCAKISTKMPHVETVAPRPQSGMASAQS